MDKLISVVIPTFDRKVLTDRAVESVTPSRPELFEIIVVDDCGTVPYAYDRIVNSGGVPVRTFRTVTNTGPGLARKLGVERSNGSVIAFLDSDDVFEKGWLDAVLAEVVKEGHSLGQGLYIAGNVAGGGRVQCGAIRFLTSVPQLWKVFVVRLAAIAFNPFFIQGVAISKELCSFSDSLRYSEDYFTNAMAIFRARKIFVLPVTACLLARSPGTPGGLTEFRRKMWRGEFQVRREILFNRSIPFGYRALVPLGVTYALARNAFKLIIGKRRVGTRGQSKGG
jgi:glycosyltransferase involved in cell wall biosynthesis